MTGGSARAGRPKPDEDGIAIRVSAFHVFTGRVATTPCLSSNALLDKLRISS
jgi:hypothetical protein